MSKDLEVRHCRVLVAVHDAGGVAAAARSLGLAQSTVSETLLSLERVLGTSVMLRRAGREAALTTAAEALLPHARALIAASESALAAVSRQSEGVIRLGTVESISSFLLPRPLSAFRQRWPRVDLRVTIGLCEDLRRRVARFELDAAITIEGAQRAAGQEGAREGGWTRKLSPAQLRLVVSPRHALAGADVGRAALEPRSFLLADPDGAFNGLLQGWLGDPARGPRLESAGSIDGVKRGVQDSDAIGVLPNYAVAEELAAGSLAEVHVRQAEGVADLVRKDNGALAILEVGVDQDLGVDRIVEAMRQRRGRPEADGQGRDRRGRIPDAQVQLRCGRLIPETQSLLDARGLRRRCRRFRHQQQRLARVEPDRLLDRRRGGGSTTRAGQEGGESEAQTAGHGDQ